MLSVVHAISIISNHRQVLVSLTNKATCRCLSSTFFKELHHVRCRMACISKDVTARPSANVARKISIIASNGPRTFSITSFYHLTRTRTMNSTRFGSLVSLTKHLCPSDPITYVGTTKMTLLHHSARHTQGCLRHFTALPRTKYGVNVLYLLRNSQKGTRICLDLTRTKKDIPTKETLHFLRDGWELATRCASSRKFIFFSPYNFTGWEVVGGQYGL